MASWDGIAVELLRKATRVDADVQFRSFTLQQQCEKLRTICQYFRNQELTLVKEKTAQQVETNAVEQSIQEAIQRARKVRAEMAAGRNEGEASGEEEEDELEKETQLDAEEQKLQDILTAKKMLRLLNSEAKALMERAPHSPPKLSLAAATHRDAMLSRIRRKKPQTSVGVVDNAILLSAARKTQTQLHDDTELWEKLQAAWVARVFTASEKVRAEPLPDAYSTTVREIVLTELSNAVLWSFKTHFTENLELDPLEMQSVMGLVRLVDSVALSQGRTYRSVLAS
ncbi:hypothetical protein BBI17_003853 [Phytophthora kernoviae]|uniref:Uncharacterized protein n=1 Tax=Phytophthora kernoviae TaxID=325452 RepID=A0A421EVE0_9STRA|nr:hypothetical protein BBI17_003853 [Phytophthora kernoviae]